MKSIILCADDYGQNQAISQAIIELLKLKRLSATSCLTTSPHWSSHAQWLMPFSGQADIGLHFNLTEGEPLSIELKRSHGFMPLSQLMLRAFTRHLDQAALAAECHAQLDAFIRVMGRLPNFVDGHQHIHHFPQVRDALLHVYEDRLKARGSYVRSVYQPLVLGKNYLKRFVIQASGARVFKKMLLDRNIPHNDVFSGIYSFADAKEYTHIFPMFLQQMRPLAKNLIMCHPGLRAEANDVIGASRHNEFNYLASTAFLQDCESHQVSLGRFD